MELPPGGRTKMWRGAGEGLDVCISAVDPTMVLFALEFL